MQARATRVKACSNADLEGEDPCKHEPQERKPTRARTWRPKVCTSAGREDEGLGKGESEFNESVQVYTGEQHGRTGRK